MTVNMWFYLSASNLKVLLLRPHELSQIFTQIAVLKIRCEMSNKTNSSIVAQLHGNAVEKTLKCAFFLPQIYVMFVMNIEYCVSV